jgi:integrase/recombinase XerD
VATTRKGYALALKQWFAFCDEHFVDPLSARSFHVELFARSVEDAGRAQSTIASKLNALSGFYKYALFEGMTNKNPMDAVRRPTIERESTTVGLTRPEAADLLTAAENSTPQDHAVVAILLLNGLRVGELLGIDVEHFSQYKGAPTVIITRKGGKRQEVPFAFRTWHGITRLMEAHPTGRGALFRSREGNRMDRKGAARIVKRMYVDAGIAKRGHPHALRHAFVTLSREHGASDADIMSSTGHKDSRMVSYYDRGKDKVERNVTHGLAVFIGRAQ